MSELGAVDACMAAVFAAGLAWACVADVRRRIIPDAAVGLCVIAWAGGIASHVALGGVSPFAAVASGLVGSVVTGGFALACSLAADRVSEGESLGGGDVKLLFAIGLHAGALAGLAVLAGACVLSLLYALVRRITGRPVSDFPFAPFLALSTAALAAASFL